MLDIEKWQKGQTGRGVRDAGLEEKVTTPPKPYDEATLLRDMEGAARFITDAKLREAMKMADGIGTPATRAGIIEKLKKDGFIVEQKGYLRATDDADRIIGALERGGNIASSLTDAAMTAIWEAGLKKVETGEMAFQTFMASQEKFVRDLVEQSDQVKTGTGGGRDAAERVTRPCADAGCSGEGDITRIKGKFGWFWSCSKRDSGCTCKIDDRNGEPVLRPLPGNSEELVPLPGTGEKCPTCRKAELVTRKVVNPSSKAFGKRILVCSNRSCKYMKGEWDIEKERVV